MKTIFSIALMLICCAEVLGQPKASSMQLIDGVKVYQDLKKSNRYYYSPGLLSLAVDKDEKPKFQLLQMRYTGTAAAGDQGSKRFFNVVQFTVVMDQVEADELTAIAKQISSRRLEMRPLPIRSIEAILVTPVGESQDAGQYKRVGKDGSFEAEGTSGMSGKDGYWTERTFTLKLENHEAQLLWDQVEQGQLALSLGYSFYADMVGGAAADTKVTGKDMENFAEENKDMLMVDTIPTIQIVRADAFPIRIDPQKWPELLRKIDINEGVPPSYAALEVRCYDFSHDLRPDLSIKAIEIEAMGVGGRPIQLPAKKFLSSDPDQFSIQIKFPYAVKLSEPFKYRITEYTKEGTKETSSWVTQDSWIGSLDISTPSAAQKFDKKNIEIEAPPLTDHGLDGVEVIVFYTFRDQHKEMHVVFEREGFPIQVAEFRVDKNTPITYRTTWRYESGEIHKDTIKDMNTIDDYVYLSVPEG